MIYLLCGVPGSGKTWVIERLPNVRHVNHDSWSRYDLVSNVKALSDNDPKSSIIVDCPFNERSLRADLEDMGLEVTPIFIVEKPSVIEERYMKREGKRPLQNILTRAETIMNKVQEWQAFYGTSEEVLKHLKAIL